MLRKLKDYIPLYAAHALKVFSFIILIPHFTQVFSKDVWGVFLSVQAFSIWLQIIVEYGFNLSATREMSQVRDDKFVIGRLVSEVLGAKIFLSTIVIIIALVACLLIPAFKENKTLVYYGMLFAIIQGFSPVWYFISQNKFAQFAMIDLLSRIAYLLSCIFLISEDTDASRVFILGSLVFSVANFVGFTIIIKSVNLQVPTISGSMKSIKEGFSMFFFVGLTSVYTTLNLLILGISAPASVVAEYGTSDRIVRASGGLLDPINRVVFSKLSYLYKNDFPSALRFLKKAAIVILGIGFLLFFLFEILAGFIISILAPEYAESVGYLKLLLVFLPILAINNILGLHIMIPLEMDKEFNLTFSTVSILSITAMFILVPIYGAYGMAVITILTESMAAIGMALFIIKRRVLRNEKNHTIV